MCVHHGGSQIGCRTHIKRIERLKRKDLGMIALCSHLSTMISCLKGNTTYDKICFMLMKLIIAYDSFFSQNIDALQLDGPIATS